MPTPRKHQSIELLAPAKNLECAREAILHGADAVYIGAPKFGARAAAGNSLEDLRETVEFAHRYYVRIYVTFNTLLKDDELDEAQSLIWDLWRIGVDALIIQDMGITRMNLPPIPLHASTQTDNRSPEKVKFLEEAGFQQVVLARELSLEQIRDISQQTKVRLEAFVHGALCVSYSGQCYMSQVLGGRSANRGVCAQYCRLPYDLTDADGRTAARQQYLLSLKDLQRSQTDLEALIDAGVSSFKIEGRLKDVSYVKNITAYYRQLIDAIIRRRPELRRSSSGESQISFTPQPDKSFNRGFTDYFLRGRQSVVHQPGAPKSMGEEIGFVRAQKIQHFIYLGKEPLHNGDGLSYFNEKGQFDGFRVNRVDGNQIYPANPHLKLKTGIRLYRTFNQEFEKQLEKSTAQRVIPVTVNLWEVPDGLALQMDDNEGHRCILRHACLKETASKPQQEQIRNLFSKASHPILRVKSCQMDWTSDFFLPISVWTALRNRLFERFEAVRSLSRPVGRTVWKQTSHPYPNLHLSYLGNVANRLAKEFYEAHQVEKADQALEIRPEGTLPDRIELMRCRHCLRYAMGLCPKNPDKSTGKSQWKEPFYLKYNNFSLRLDFDCKFCEMVVCYDRKDPRCQGL